MQVNILLIAVNIVFYSLYSIRKISHNFTYSQLVICLLTFKLDQRNSQLKRVPHKRIWYDYLQKSAMTQLYWKARFTKLTKDIPDFQLDFISSRKYKSEPYLDYLLVYIIQTLNNNKTNYILCNIILYIVWYVIGSASILVVNSRGKAL